MNLIQSQINNNYKRQAKKNTKRNEKLNNKISQTSSSKKWLSLTLKKMSCYVGVLTIFDTKYAKTTIEDKPFRELLETSKQETIR